MILNITGAGIWNDDCSLAGDSDDDTSVYTQQATVVDDNSNDDATAAAAEDNLQETHITDIQTYTQVLLLAAIFRHTAGYCWAFNTRLFFQVLLGHQLCRSFVMLRFQQIMG